MSSRVRWFVALLAYAAAGLTFAFLAATEAAWRAPDLTFFPADVVTAAPWLVVPAYLCATAGWLLTVPATSSRQRLRHVVTPVLVFAAPLLLAPPFGSNDVYAYAEAGWTANAGLDPYTTAVGSVPESTTHDLVQVWAGTFTPYGPLSIGVFRVLEWLSFGHVEAFVVLVRALCIAAVVAILCAGRAADRRLGAHPNRIAWFAALNPVVLVNGIGGVHVDVLAAALVAAALAVAARRTLRAQLGSVALIAVAAAIRQPCVVVAVVPVVGLVRVLPRSGPSWRRIGVAVGSAGLLGLAVFQLVTSATGTGWGWMSNLSTPGFTASSPIGIASALTGLPPSSGGLALAVTGVGAVVTALVVWAWARQDLVLATGLAFLLLQTFAMKGLLPWYFVAPLVTLAFAAPRERNRVVAVVTTLACITHSTWVDRGWVAELSVPAHPVVKGVVVGGLVVAFVAVLLVAALRCTRPLDDARTTG